jgi:hypothetical protein
MLETVRKYGLEMLTATDEENKAGPAKAGPALFSEWLYVSNGFFACA